MTRRAITRPGTWKQNWLMAMAMSSAVILLGCGGGGGGAPPPPVSRDCNVGDGTTVVCGFVVNSAGAGVSGATVKLKDINNNTLLQGASNSTGFFVLKSVPANAALFQVDPPAGPDYFANTMTYRGATYLFYTPNQAGTGPCIPAIPAVTRNQDNAIGNATLYLVNGGPPAPPSGCPR
jgi:hypothetical protein